jgi:hypothetical protein
MQNTIGRFKGHLTKCNAFKQAVPKAEFSMLIKNMPSSQKGNMSKIDNSKIMYHTALMEEPPAPKHSSAEDSDSDSDNEDTGPTSSGEPDVAAISKFAASSTPDFESMSPTELMAFARNAHQQLQLFTGKNLPASDKKQFVFIRDVCDEARKKEVDRLWCKWLFKASLPHALFENADWQEAIAYMHPAYAKHGFARLGRKVVGSLDVAAGGRLGMQLADTKKKTDLYIGKQSYMSASADGWKDRRGRELQNITVSDDDGNTFLENSYSNPGHRQDADFLMEATQATRERSNVKHWNTDNPSVQVAFRNKVREEDPTVTTSACEFHCIDGMALRFMQNGEIRTAVDTAQDICKKFKAINLIAEKLDIARADFNAKEKVRAALVGEKPKLQKSPSLMGKTRKVSAVNPLTTCAGAASSMKKVLEDAEVEQYINGMSRQDREKFLAIMEPVTQMFNSKMDLIRAAAELFKVLSMWQRQSETTAENSSDTMESFERAAQLIGDFQHDGLSTEAVEWCCSVVTDRFEVQLSGSMALCCKIDPRRMKQGKGFSTDLEKKAADYFTKLISSLPQSDRVTIRKQYADYIQGKLLTDDQLELASEISLPIFFKTNGAAFQLLTDVVCLPLVSEVSTACQVERVNSDMAFIHSQKRVVLGHDKLTAEAYIRVNERTLGNIANPSKKQRDYSLGGQWKNFTSVSAPIIEDYDENSFDGIGTCGDDDNNDDSDIVSSSRSIAGGIEKTVEEDAEVTQENNQMTQGGDAMTEFQQSPKLGSMTEAIDDGTITKSVVAAKSLAPEAPVDQMDADGTVRRALGTMGPKPNPRNLSSICEDCETNRPGYGLQLEMKCRWCSRCAQQHPGAQPIYKMLGKRVKGVANKGGRPKKQAVKPLKETPAPKVRPEKKKKTPAPKVRPEKKKAASKIPVATKPAKAAAKRTKAVAGGGNAGHTARVIATHGA